LAAFRAAPASRQQYSLLFVVSGSHEVIIICAALACVCSSGCAGVRSVCLLAVCSILFSLRGCCVLKLASPPPLPRPPLSLRPTTLSTWPHICDLCGKPTGILHRPARHSFGPAQKWANYFNFHYRIAMIAIRSLALCILFTGMSDGFSLAVFGFCGLLTHF